MTLSDDGHISDSEDEDEDEELSEGEKDDVDDKKSVFDISDAEEKKLLSSPYPIYPEGTPFPSRSGSPVRVSEQFRKDNSMVCFIFLGKSTSWILLLV